MSYLLNKNDKPVHTQTYVSAARTLVSPSKMQELPTLALCMAKIPQLSTKEDQGC